MVYFILAILIVAADQIFKFWITANIQLGGEMGLIPGIIHLTYVKNTGAAFSMMSGMRWVLVGITAVCVIAVIVVLIRNKFNTIGRLSLSFVLGGAIGNLIDRVLNGFVVDMFEVEFFRFAVFNIADCFVVVGGILFCIYYTVYIAKEEQAEKKAAAKKKDQLHKTLESLNVPQTQDWSETKILEEYDLERLLSEDDKSNNG